MSASPRWSNLLSVMRWHRSKLFSRFLGLGREWMLSKPTIRSYYIVCLIIWFPKWDCYSLVSYLNVFFFIWGQFYVRRHSYWGPADPVCLAIIGGPGTVGPTEIDF